MVIHVVECPKCFRARWHATGRFNVNRHGLKRAECVCEVCGYAFSSGRPEAIAAGEAITVPQSDAPSTDTEPSTDFRSRLRSAAERGGMVPVGALVGDWKIKQAGDE